MSVTRELEGRTAIVTGAGRGIGQAIAVALAAAGSRVVLTGRDPARGAAAAAAIQADGGEALFMKADQGSDADWIATVAAAQDRFGAPRIVVINAGLAGAIPTQDMSLEDFRALNRVNLKGAFLGVKHAAAAMRAAGGGGSIILMASIVGKVGVANHAHYAASKGGVRLLAKAAALELGPDQIRVNSIHPGMTRTDMIAGFPPQIADAIPLGRFGEPRDVAEAALFLASDRSIFMTGAELVVDGGWIAQ